MSLAGPGLWLPPTSLCLSGKSRIRHIPGRPGCHPTGLGRAPRGRLVSGLEKLVFLPTPPSTATILDFEEERVSAGAGGSPHSTQDGNGRGVPEERRQEKAQERRSGVGTHQEPLQPVRLDLLVRGIFNRLQKQEENGS